MGCGMSQLVVAQEEPRTEPEGKHDKSQTPTEQQGPLTDRQIAVVQETWRLVVPDLQGHGVVLYER